MHLLVAAPDRQKSIGNSLWPLAWALIYQYNDPIFRKLNREMEEFVCIFASYDGAVEGSSIRKMARLLMVLRFCWWTGLRTRLGRCFVPLQPDVLRIRDSAEQGCASDYRRKNQVMRNSWHNSGADSLTPAVATEGEE
jgi:hypothetical protein